MEAVEHHCSFYYPHFSFFVVIFEITYVFFVTVCKLRNFSHNFISTHLNVEAELLKAFEQRFFVAGHEGLHVRVDR